VSYSGYLSLMRIHWFTEF